jgi:hypothetical protein
MVRKAFCKSRDQIATANWMGTTRTFEKDQKQPGTEICVPLMTQAGLTLKLLI